MDNTRHQKTGRNTTEQDKTNKTNITKQYMQTHKYTPCNQSPYTRTYILNVHSLETTALNRLWTNLSVPTEISVYISN
ncbi:hypothetical protein CHS0354_006053, partial [Potamilus streckersoni]